MTQIRFQCQDNLPMASEMQKYHSFIGTLGMKLMATYYARKLGSVFDFPQICSVNMDNCQSFLEVPCKGWGHGGLFNLYSESFAWEDPLAQFFDEDGEDMEMPSLSDFICAAFHTFGNNESTVSVYSPKGADECEEDSYFLVDEFCEEGWNILYDHFCRKKPIPYPDDALGEVVERGMDAISELLGCDAGTEYFQHCTAFSWLKLMNNMFISDDEQDEGFFAVLTSSHPRGESIRKKCAKRKEEPFYGMASEIIEACLTQIASATCETGENPDWYEYDIVRDEESLSVSVAYRQDSGLDITVISMAIYLLTWVIRAVEEKEEKERNV